MAMLVITRLGKSKKSQQLGDPPWVQRLNNPQPSHHVAGKDVPKIWCLRKWGPPYF